jgi:hypothetical protein
MQIEGSEAKFEISILGKFTKETYIGKFKVKCILSPLEEIEADKIYRDLLGNNYHLSDEIIKQKAFALAQLNVRILQAPPFWENDRIGGGHISDSNVILEVLDKAIEAQELYVEGKEKEMKERQEALTKAIKNKVIQKEPELDNVEDPNAEALADLEEEETGEKEDFE